MVHFTFLSGERYCCMDSGCNFGHWERAQWRSIRRDLRELGGGHLGPLTIRLRVEGQEGALFGLRGPDDTAELQPRAALAYEVGPFHESAPCVHEKR